LVIKYLNNKCKFLIDKKISDNEIKNIDVFTNLSSLTNLVDLSIDLELFYFKSIAINILIFWILIFQIKLSEN